MTFYESFDEWAERQHSETSCAGVFQGKPDQSIGESATLEALIHLGVDERNQAGECSIDGEPNHLTINRELIAIAVGCVSYLDTFRYSHARNIRALIRFGAPNPGRPSSVGAPRVAGDVV